ncbi:MAG: hypothetical protein WBC36_14930 [Desulfobacterales bacterium]
MIYKYYNNSLKSLRLKEAGAILIFIFLALHLTIESSSIYAQSNNQKILISYKNDLLSISTKDADLKKVLLKLSDKTNINIKLPVYMDKKITINKNGISLGEGLEYLLKNLNHIILYSGIKNNKPMISRVIVLSGSKKSTKLTDSKTQAANSRTQAANSETQAASSETQTASSIVQLPNSEMQAADIIKGYEKQIEILKKKLSTIPENSRLRKHYIKRIKILEKFIENYESRTPN